jgi:hypothetical protein
MKRVKEGKSGLMYFLCMYACGTLKPVKVILKGEEGKGRVMEGMNQTGVQYWYIQKCHNETSCTTIK